VIDLSCEGEYLGTVNDMASARKLADCVAKDRATATKQFVTFDLVDTSTRDRVRYESPSDPALRR
jgi:hypothetical protein